MSSRPLKLLVVGAPKTGKSVLATLLSDTKDLSTVDVSKLPYRPTKGVRIMEFADENNVNIELWDVGGDERYQSCWPIIARDVKGIIYVATSDSHQEMEKLKLFKQYFSQACVGVSDDHCVVMINSIGDNAAISQLKLPNELKGISQSSISLDSAHQSFNRYVKQLMTAMKSKDEE